MAILKCKMCGGDIELSADKTFGTCDSCGSLMTFPKVDDEQRANMFNRGNHFRRTGEFDKALAVYERIVQEDENDAEAHWCCALCRFGIEYVEDPNTFEYLPTCHRASFDSFLEDVDYLAAVEHSDGVTRRQYQKDAAKIAEVQRGILATSQNEEPFDVFICYKESENDGTRTRDSLLAQEIYYQLTEQGRRVFFSRITLEDKAGTEYEPYIFAALNSAKVMIVVTTSAEHVNAVWVKNEWSRFLSLMRKDRSKLLLPCYRDMDPYDLPEALSVLQSYDMSKIGFIQDLTRGVNKVLNAGKPKETVKETVVVQQQAQSNTAPLLKRAFMFLEDGDFTRADEFCEQVLNLDPENSEAYLGKLMAELHVRTRDALKDQPEPFNDRNNYKKAMRFGDEALKQKLTADATFIKERNETARKEEIYRKAFRWMQEQKFTEAKSLFDSISDYKDAEALSKACTKKEEAEAARKTTEARIAAERATKKRKRIIVIVISIISIIVMCIAFVFALTTFIIPNQKYAAAVELYNAGKYEDAIAAFSAANGYKDSYEKIREIEEYQKYTDVVELYNAGKYEDAIAVFTALDRDKISAVKIDEIKPKIYDAGVKLNNTGNFEDAIVAFSALSGYKDSAAKIDEIKSKKYTDAVELYTAGKFMDAIAVFNALNGYKDCAAKIDEIKPKYYKQLLSAVNVGSTVFFGSYEQDNDISNGKETIEWLVLATEGDRALIISKYALDCQKYNSTDTVVTWETCSLREWLNETFLNAAFSESERAMIPRATVTDDKVFLLSDTETSEYFNTEEARECYKTEYRYAHGSGQGGEAHCSWWLRSPTMMTSSEPSSCWARYVWGDGGLNYMPVTTGNICVRPALWIDLGS